MPWSGTWRTNNTNAIIPFNYEGQQVRTVEINEEPWFVAKDVVNAIGASWRGAWSINHVPRIWKGVQSVCTPGGIQEMSVLSEQGLYFFLNRSDKEDAIPFQMKVNGEILPTIRKTGTYQMQQEPQFNVPQTFADALRLAADQQEKIAQVTHERDKAVREKAWVAEGREGTCFSKTGVLTRENKRLKERLGTSDTWKQAKAIPWLREYFWLMIPGAWSAIGQHLRKISLEMDYGMRKAASTEYANGVNIYHIDVIDEFRRRLNADRAYMRKYRIVTDEDFLDF